MVWITVGALHVLPPLVDFENIIEASVPPQSLVGPVGGQCIHVAYTVPSLPTARSLNWSTPTERFCTAPGKVVLQVVPLSHEWDTEIWSWEKELLNSVMEMYTQP